MPPAVKALGAKGLNLFHRTVLTLTGGRFGWTAAGMPVVELHTIGRKSGQVRSVMLTSPVQLGDGDQTAYVLVASYGGDDRHPAWYLNIEAQPEVEATIGGVRRPVRARTMTADEKRDLWPQVVESYKDYATYQRKTDRDIPLVLVEPR